MTDLILCSRCKCKQLPEFYSLRKNTGLLCKTCNKCRRMLSPLECNECDFICKEQKKLNRHIKVAHEGLDPTRCEVCDKSFSNIHQYNRHIKVVHMLHYTHKCCHCDYKSSNSSNIKKHIAAIHREVLLLGE